VGKFDLISFDLKKMVSTSAFVVVSIRFVTLLLSEDGNVKRCFPRPDRGLHDSGATQSPRSPIRFPRRTNMDRW
jgi:hypothetical protein